VTSEHIHMVCEMKWRKRGKFYQKLTSMLMGLKNTRSRILCILSALLLSLANSVCSALRDCSAVLCSKGWVEQFHLKGFLQFPSLFQVCRLNEVDLIRKPRCSLESFKTKFPPLKLGAYRCLTTMRHFLHFQELTA